LLDRTASRFARTKAASSGGDAAAEAQLARLYEKIGQLTVNGEVLLALCAASSGTDLEKSDIIMDSLGSHNIQGMREVHRTAGAALMFIPCHSPDLNPIEIAFSKSNQSRG
jgi:DDE superfamily endonuclease